MQEEHCTGPPASCVSGGLTHSPGDTSAWSAGERTPAQSAQKLAPSGLAYPQWGQTKEVDILQRYGPDAAGL
ncbi:hypothetical protein E6H36_03380 [Candidatus Bathyarchaeota archaeon]|nr:MAG: hypothetical protein E6H36_03380 [Candidatus Bathyarchaeota archaeon]